MAGLRGNQAYFAWAKQTARATPNTTYARRSPFAGGSISPTRTVENLEETDDNRDQGESFVSVVGVEGAPELYARFSEIPSLSEAALGANATTGAGPYEHTASPANTIPYITVLRGVGDTLWEQFDDCFVNEFTLTAEAGQPVMATVDLAGRQATRLAAEPGSLPSLAAATPPTFNDAAVTLASGATSLVSSFELTVSNNVTVQQTDEYVPYDVVVGQREVTLGFTLIFDSLDEYNKFHYGGAAGTTQSGALNVTDANFTFTVGADILNVDLPNIAYEEFPVDPDPGGDPIEVDVRARAQRDAVDDVVTIVTTNADTDPWV
jgi:hypothetical protein